MGAEYKWQTWRAIPKQKSHGQGLQQKELEPRYTKVGAIKNLEREHQAVAEFGLDKGISV